MQSDLYKSVESSSSLTDISNYSDPDLELFKSIGDDITSTDETSSYNLIFFYYNNYRK